MKCRDRYRYDGIDTGRDGEYKSVRPTTWFHFFASKLADHWLPTDIVVRFLVI